MIDLPNTLDDKWQIDIKKSIARPPLKIQSQLRAYAKDVRAHAVDVYRHRGKVLQRKHPSFKYTPVWQEKQRHGKRFYSINKKHPVIGKLLEEPTKENLNELLKFIEETLPVPLITIKESEEPDSHGTAFENLEHEILRKRMREMFDTVIQQGKSIEEAGAIVSKIDPFDKYPQYLNFIIEEYD